MSDEPRCGVEHPDLPGVRCAWPLGHQPSGQHGAEYSGVDGQHYAIWSTDQPQEE